MSSDCHPAHLPQSLLAHGESGYLRDDTIITVYSFLTQEALSQADINGQHKLKMVEGTNVGLREVAVQQ